MNQQEQFLKEIKTDSPVLNDQDFQDLFDGKKKDNPQAEKPTPEEGEEFPNTRKYRRLQDKLQKEREMNIALNERIKALSELKTYSETNPETDVDALKVFGTDENGKLLKGYFDRRFNEVREEAERAALEKIKAEQAEDAEEERRNSERIDTAFENIEDKYNVDLSGDTQSSKRLRNGFIDYVERISPKDANGEILEYADMESSFEDYLKLSNSAGREVSQRQKELASRSMTRSGTSVPEMPKGPITFKTVGRLLDSWQNQ